MSAERSTERVAVAEVCDSADIAPGVRIQPNGTGEASEHGGIETPFLLPVMSPVQKRQYLLLLGIWLINLIIFWAWWLQPAHVVTTQGMIVTSLLIVWSTLIPAYFFLIVWGMRKPNPELPLPDGDVAMIVTKSPSEPWAVVQRTLEAMASQVFPRPFDIWLADEDPSPQTELWCAEHGIKISSRRGVASYHQATWPRRTRCKEGNLAYFYDHWGYRLYDFVVQLDADHVPEPGYLEAMIRPFLDESVGYVAAPSICDNNAATSWAARARLYAEGSKHGPLQAGYNRGLAPLCIGSHYAVRTHALKTIGGLGPELAEDHSTTMLMSAGGWKGVFALDAIAHGEGPTSFTDAMTQEFQWSRSLVRILLTLTPGCLRKLSWPLRFEFLFAQLWYVLFGGYMAVAYALPLIALLTKTPWVNVNLFLFIWQFTRLTASCLVVAIWLRRQGWFRPTQAKVISWETVVFEIARWPWVVWGVISALIDTITHSEPIFKVTPKGASAEHSLPARLLMPYVLLIAAACACATLIPSADAASGYYYFAVYYCVTYFLVLWRITLSHVREVRAAHGDGAVRRIDWPVIQVLVASVLVIVALLMREVQAARILIQT